MNVLVLDVETTGATNDTKGNPFTISNRLCYIGLCFNNHYSDYDVEYSGSPYGKNLESVRENIHNSDILIGFNIKFDLHWLRRYGITNFQNKKIWDCQAVEFILHKQQWPFPDLGMALAKRNLPKKLDTVKMEYWEKGIDTDRIPSEVLREYLQADVEGTGQLYYGQMDEVRKLPFETQRLIDLVNQDVLVLEEMEWNGLSFKMDESRKEAIELGLQIVDLDKILSDITGLTWVNFNSGDVISCLLYGGLLKETFKEVYTFTYKDGRTALKERWSVRKHLLPTLVEPLPKTGLKKDGFYKTDEGTLRKLKGNSKVNKIIKLLLERAKLEKLQSTYYEGFPKLHAEMGWEPDVLHGQLIQVNAATGRLSSSKPNQQNIPDEVRKLTTTRFI